MLTPKQPLEKSKKKKRWNEKQKQSKHKLVASLDVYMYVCLSVSVAHKHELYDQPQCEASLCNAPTTPLYAPPHHKASTVGAIC